MPPIFAAPAAVTPAKQPRRFGSIVDRRSMWKDCTAANGKSFTSAIVGRAGGAGVAIALPPPGSRPAMPKLPMVLPMTNKAIWVF